MYIYIISYMHEGHEGEGREGERWWYVHVGYENGI